MTSGRGARGRATEGARGREATGGTRGRATGGARGRVTGGTREPATKGARGRAKKGRGDGQQEGRGNATWHPQAPARHSTSAWTAPTRKGGKGVAGFFFQVHSPGDFGVPVEPTLGCDPL